MKETFPKSFVMIIADMVGYADGGVVSKQVLKNDAGNITLFSFDEGAGLERTHCPFDALVQNLEGEVEIVLAGQPLRLKRGESVIMPAGMKHPLRAVTRFKMLLTMIRD
ncbi:MAG: cupin domain-containing protein [Alistipes indistinctus]